jgi:hypothetical protein
MKNLKDMIMSGFLSLSKAEQDMLKDVVNSTGQNEVQQEQQVRKSEIKVISRKRFYDILDKADEYMSQRDKEKFKLLMEQRGLVDLDISFKNHISSNMFGQVEFKFKTDNGIFRFANAAHVKNLPNGQKEIIFFINSTEHPSVNAHFHKLSNLQFFAVEENRTKYAYNILGYAGNEKQGFDIVLRFIGEAVVDGERKTYDDDEDRLMTKKDLIQKPDTYTLGSNDFIL